jgi:hypothetical protein
VLPLEAPPAPPLSAPVPGVAAGGDPDDGGGDSSSSHDTNFSADQEPEGWVARPITRDAARECHFHNALDTLLRQALGRRTWSIEYRCVVFQHSHGVYPDHWEATCLVRRPESSLRGAEICLEHYSISERDSAEAAMQDAARRALSHYCSVLGVIVSPVGEDNPRLSSTVNLAVMLNMELDHALDELNRARVEIAQLRAERAERRHLDDGSPAPVGTQHPYRSPRRGHQSYGNLGCKTKIDLEP